MEMNTPKQDELMPCRYGLVHKDICGCYNYNQYEIEGLSEKLVLAEAKIAELEKTITEMQIQHSRGLYTPAHEADRKRLIAVNASLEEKLKIAVKALEKLDTQFKSVQMHQQRLLVRGQTLESANMNWEEAASIDFIDFGIIKKALDQISGSSKKE